MTRVLIVDKRPEGRRLLRALLEGHISDVVEASDGPQALALARQDPPELVVSDLVLPGMDGCSLLRQWKADERLRAIPFVVCSAAGIDLKDEQLALDLGANAVIREPVEPQVFMARIREVLAGAPRQAGERLAAGPAGTATATATATAVRDAQGRDRHMRIAVAAAVGTLVAFILIGLAFSLAGQRQDVLEDAEQTAQNLVRVTEEHASGSVNAVDVTLASVARVEEVARRILALNVSVG